MSIDESSSQSQQKRIAVRFGDDLLQEGFTTVPNLVLRYYAYLNIPPAEMLFIIHVWQFWWTDKDPYPSLPTIAAQLDISRRQAQKYVASLKAKGYLVVRDRYQKGLGQLSSEYDFSGLLRVIRVLHSLLGPITKRDDRYVLAKAIGAIFLEPDEEQARRKLAETVGGLRGSFPDVAARLAEMAQDVIFANRDTPRNSRSRGGMNASSRGPWNRGSTEEDEEQEDPVEEDENTISNSAATGNLHKIKTDLRVTSLRQQNVENMADPLVDRLPDQAAVPTGFASVGQVLTQRQTLKTAPTGQKVTAGHGRAPKASPYIEAVMADVSAKLHDEQPHSSLTRATRLWKTSGLAEEAFVQRLYEARSIARQQGNVKKPAAAGHGTINRMPYFFAVVEDLLGLKEGRG